MPTASIAMGTRVSPIGSMGNQNPMEMMSDMMKLRLGMAEYGARQSLGGILATSPDVDTAFQRYSQDPNAGFFPEGLTQLRSMKLLESQLQTQGLERQRISAATTGLNINNAMDIHKQSLGMSINNPEMLEKNTADLLGFLPPDQRPAVEKLLQDRNESLLGGLPPSGDPDRLNQYWLRTHGMMVATGMSPADVYGARGLIPPTVETGPYGPGGAQQAVPAFGYPGPTGAPAGGGQPAVGAGPRLGGYNVPTGPTQTMTTEQEERGKTLSDYRERLDTSVQTGASLMQNISEARDVMAAFRPGPGEGRFVQAAETAKALGASDEVVAGIAHGDLAAAQTFEKLAASQAMAALDTNLPHGSRANVREWDTFKASNPGLDMLPGAIENIFNFWGRTFVRNRIEQRDLQTFIKGGGSLDDWPQKWQDIQERNGLLKSHFTGRKGTADVSIDPRAVLHLLAHPETAGQFDSSFGPGSSDKFLHKME
jgi:hypothetical protein